MVSFIFFMVCGYLISYVPYVRKLLDMNIFKSSAKFVTGVLVVFVCLDTILHVIVCSFFLGLKLIPTMYGLGVFVAVMAIPFTFSVGPIADFLINNSYDGFILYIKPACNLLLSVIVVLIENRFIRKIPDYIPFSNYENHFTLLE